jgi:hypothetical protein
MKISQNSYITSPPSHTKEHLDIKDRKYYASAAILNLRLG